MICRIKHDIRAGSLCECLHVVIDVRVGSGIFVDVDPRTDQAADHARVILRLAQHIRTDRAAMAFLGGIETAFCLGYVQHLAHCHLFVQQRQIFRTEHAEFHADRLEIQTKTIKNFVFAHY